jgi:hypothetical protein
MRRPEAVGAAWVTGWAIEEEEEDEDEEEDGAEEEDGIYAGGGL